MEDFVVSARKYRPDTFDSVVGQKAITATLKNSIRNGHLAQSFLFCGPRGVGKTTCARILARTINCSDPGPELEPCGQCESCKGFLKNASQNIYELDAASNRNVEAMRTLVEQVRIPPQVGKYKVYIIDEVHMLTPEAFNAFLKTLEEPPAYAKFILATTEKNKIIPTILSRCQIFDFKRIRVEDMVEHLKMICQKEGISYEEEALRVVAQKADGGLRDALSMFDQIVSFSGNSITYKQAISMLNILDYETYFEMFGYFLQGNVSSALNLFNQVLENGFDGQMFANGLGGHLRSLLLMKDTQTEELVESSAVLRQRYKEQASACSVERLLQGLELCSQCDLQYRNSNHKRLLVEILLLQLIRVFEGGNLAKKEGEAPISGPGEFSGQAERPARKAGIGEEAAEPARGRASESPVPASSPEVFRGAGQATGQAAGPFVQEEGRVPVSTQSPAAVQGSGAFDPKPSSPEAPEPSSSLSRPLRSAVSLQGLSAQLKERDDARVPKAEEALADEAFDQEALDTAWKAYLATIQTSKPGFFNLLSMANPHAGKDHAVELVVSSRYASEELAQGQKPVLDFLRDRLHNRSVHFIVRVDENLKPEVVIYTPQEKFQKMAASNPELQHFRDSLNLDIEL